MIKIYTYLKTNGHYSRTLSGDIDSCIASITLYENFTLTSLPDDIQTWRWSGTRWVKVLEPSPILGFTNITSNLTYKTFKSDYTGETITYEGDRRVNNVPS